jgi:hypothetical protein
VKRRNVYLAAAILALGALTSCGDDDDDGGDVADANAQFCEDLTAYVDALRSAADLDAQTATKADYDAARDELISTSEDVSESASALTRSEWENLEAEIEELGDQLGEAPDDVAVASIIDSAQAQVDTVQTSAATVNTAVCTTGTTTTAG